ncbi:hypothetical protein D3C87_2002790 [compost metagenome]
MPHTTYAPRMMKATMAVIFTVENQYSMVPNALTLIAFTRISAPENTHTHSQPGTSGNQKCMYSATAVTSVPTASTTHDQYA